MKLILYWIKRNHVLVTSAGTSNSQRTAKYPIIHLLTQTGKPRETGGGGGTQSHRSTDQHTRTKEKASQQGLRGTHRHPQRPRERTQSCDEIYKQKVMISYQYWDSWTQKFSAMPIFVSSSISPLRCERCSANLLSVSRISSVLSLSIPIERI